MLSVTAWGSSQQLSEMQPIELESGQGNASSVTQQAADVPSSADEIETSESKTDLSEESTQQSGPSAFGVVVDEDGKPLEGVKIQAATPVQGFHSSFSTPTGGDDIPGKTAVTDKAGRFRIDDLANHIPIKSAVTDKAGLYTIGRAPKGQPQFNVTIPESEVMLRLRSPYRWTNDSNYKLGQELRIVLRGSGKQGMLRMKLVDDVSGKPIPEFMVVRRHIPKMQTTRNENGEYDVKGEFTRHGKSSVCCYAPGYEAKRVSVEALDPNSDERSEVRLKPRPSLEVQIVDRKTGKPIPKAKVMAVSLGSGKYPGRSMTWGEIDRYVDGNFFDFVRRKFTDESGLVEFSRLPEGEAALIVLVDGYQRTIVRPEDRDAFAIVRGVLQIALEAESSIVGQLTENGQPVADQNVSIYTNQKVGGLDQVLSGTKTDKQGRYEIRGLRPGEYWITVAGRGSRITIGDEQYRHDVASTGTTVLGKTYSNASVQATPEFKTSYTSI